MRRLREFLRGRDDLAILAGFLVLAGALRFARTGLLDIFEDGYHHWWIGGSWAESGRYLDPMSRMTEGNWLPGYYPIVALAHILAGPAALLALRALSIAASLATLVLVFRMARPRGLLAASFASFCYAIFLQGNLIGSMAIPESLVVLFVLAATYVLFVGKALPQPWRLAIAAVLLLGASALRYEAWIAVGVLPIYAWRTHRMRVRDALLVAAPTLAFAAAWAIVLLPSGGLLSIVFGQTAPEAQNQIALGTMPGAPWERLAWFWISNHATGLLPMYLLGSGVMIARQRSEYATWVSAVLFLGVSGIVLGGIGTGSYRYVAIADPFVAVAAGMAVPAIVRRLATLRVPRSAATVALVSVLVVVSVVNVAWITDRIDGVTQLHEPLRRAGLWVGRQAWTDERLLLSDSPIATYYAGIEPSRAWSSWWLPADRTEALAVLRASYAYVIFVNVSYYPLLRLFPELQGGADTADFLLAHDPNGWELQYGAKQVFVYAVRP